MRVLVTGASGFIGRYLIPELLSAGHSISVLLLETFRDQTGLPGDFRSLLPQLQVVYGDLRNPHLTAQALRDARPEAVIHLAAVGVTDPFIQVEVALQSNLRGTIHLLQAAFENGANRETINKIIIARTPGELSCMNIYAASKAAAWAFCRMYAQTRQWPIIGAMIFQAYGPGQPDHTLISGAFKAALAGSDFPATYGTQQKDWIFARDIAKAFSATLMSNIEPGTTVEFGTGKLTTVADVLKKIYSLVGGNGNPLLGAKPNRPGEEIRQLANWQQTSDLIDWKAETSLDQGLQMMLDALA